MSPFTTDRSASVAALGELGLLGRIREWLGEAAPSAPHGMGDDCAVTRADVNLLTNDSLVHGLHFDDSATAWQAGAKLLKRNLSDIAAMGGQPHDAVVALFLPPNTRIDWLQGFTEGLRDCGLRHGARIVGGDLTQTSGFLGGTLTLTGYSLRPLLRTGAGEGAAIYVSGCLGGSISGHHLDFEPRLPEGQFLAGEDGVVSCIDVTDGLAKDLPALLGPGLAAELDVAALPASAAARAAAAAGAGDATARLLDHILGDGEDYELLFTLRPGIAYDAFEARWRERFGTRLTRIGQVVRHPGGPVLLDAHTRKPLQSRSGFHHLGGGA